MFSVVNWDKLQCNLANLNLSGNGGCSDKESTEVQGARKSIWKKKQHAYFLQHPEGAILVIADWCYFCRCDIHVGCKYIFFSKELSLNTALYQASLEAPYLENHNISTVFLTVFFQQYCSQFCSFVFLYHQLSTLAGNIHWKGEQIQANWLLNPFWELIWFSVKNINMFFLLTYKNIKVTILNSKTV